MPDSPTDDESPAEPKRLTWAAAPGCVPFGAEGIAAMPAPQPAPVAPPPSISEPVFAAQPAPVFASPAPVPAAPAEFLPSPVGPALTPEMRRWYLQQHGFYRGS